MGIRVRAVEPAGGRGARFGRIAGAEAAQREV